MASNWDFGKATAFASIHGRKKSLPERLRHVPITQPADIVPPVSTPVNRDPQGSVTRPATPEEEEQMSSNERKKRHAEKQRAKSPEAYSEGNHSQAPSRASSTSSISVAPVFNRIRDYIQDSSSPDLRGRRNEVVRIFNRLPEIEQQNCANEAQGVILSLLDFLKIEREDLTDSEEYRELFTITLTRIVLRYHDGLRAGYMAETPVKPSSPIERARKQAQETVKRIESSREPSLVGDGYESDQSPPSVRAQAVRNLAKPQGVNESDSAYAR